MSTSNSPERSLPPWQIVHVVVEDLTDLLPPMRAYCDFYGVSPADSDLLKMARALIDDPGRILFCQQQSVRRPSLRRAHSEHRPTVSDAVGRLAPCWRCSAVGSRAEGAGLTSASSRPA